MNFTKINSNLFLVEQPIKNEKAVQRQPLSHIWIVDRSGSMYSELPHVIDDLKQKARTLELGSTLSFGWFSSEGGDFKFPIRGFKLSEQKDYEALDKLFDANRQARNMTCFSEILTESLQVIADLTPFNPSFSIVFFSDGYPVVNSYAAELKKINEALSDLNGKVSSALLVGYGGYFNKELMSQMAERVGGVLISARELHTFSESMNQFLADAGGANPKQQIVLGRVPLYPFALALTENSVMALAVDEKNSVSYSPREGDNAIYYLTDKAPKGTEVELTEAIYAMALTLIQRTNTNAALELLSALGDVALIKQATNAFTNAEYASVEDWINMAVFQSKARYREGKKANYLPPADAFCLIDAMDLLLQEENAKFLPYHPSMDYKRIGRASKAVEGAPVFNKNLDAAVPIKDLVWHESRLNLSIKARIPGTVDLQGDYKSFGFAETYPTHIYRNYAVIKDGFTNIERLPVANLSESTFQTLQENGIIEKYYTYSDGLFILNLAAVPVMNRAMARGRTSAKDACQKTLRELQLTGDLKVLNYYKKLLNPDKFSSGSALSREQQTFLADNDIRGDGTFSPKTEEAEATDFYYVKEFEIKVKGISSLPKVEDVLKKLGKPMTASQQLLEPMITKFLALTGTPAEKLAWVDTQLLSTKIELRTLRADLQRTKFAILLGKAWFDEFTSRSENKLVLDGLEYTFSYRDDVKVSI